MHMSKRKGDGLEWLPLTWRPGFSLRRQGPEGAGAVVGRFFSAELSSVYQPIVDAASGQRVGREAFVRSHSAGRADLSPWNLFSLVADDDTLVGLDRLCRTVHVLNDPLAGAPDELLFLNVHGRLLAAVADDHGRAFRRVLDVLRRPPAGVVIETPEAACADPRLLAFVLTNYRLNGFRVAANVSSIADLEAVLHEVRPSFVKIDWRQLGRFDEAAQFVRLADEQGVRTIFTRVEQAEALAQLARLPNVWAQGYAVADNLSAAPATVVPADAAAGEAEPHTLAGDVAGVAGVTGAPAAPNASGPDAPARICHG